VQDTLRLCPVTLLASVMFLIYVLQMKFDLILFEFTELRTSPFIVSSRLGIQDYLQLFRA